MRTTEALHVGLMLGEICAIGIESYIHNRNISQDDCLDVLICVAHVAQGS